MLLVLVLSSAYSKADNSGDNVIAQAHITIDTNTLASTRASEAAVSAPWRRDGQHDNFPTRSADHPQSCAAPLGHPTTRILRGAQ